MFYFWNNSKRFRLFWTDMTVTIRQLWSDCPSPVPLTQKHVSSFFFCFLSLYMSFKLLINCLQWRVEIWFFFLQPVLWFWLIRSIYLLSFVNKCFRLMVIWLICFYYTLLSRYQIKCPSLVILALQSATLIKFCHNNIIPQKRLLKPLC